MYYNLHLGMVYSCSECNKSFQKKSHLDYHVEHKSCKVPRFFCKYCEKGFTSDSSMYRHMKHTCKERVRQNNNNNEMKEIIVSLQKDVEELKKNNTELRKKVTKSEKQKPNVTNNNTYIMTGDINQTINNYMIGFGKEDMDLIDKEDMMVAFRNGFKSTIQLTKAVHFNPKYPEYSNIKRTNSSSSYARYHDGQKWMEIKVKDLVDNIYERKRDYIEDNLDEYFDKLTKSQKNGLHRWLSTDDDHQRIQSVKAEIKSLLWNERQLAENNERVLIDRQKNNICILDESDTVITDIDIDKYDSEPIKIKGRKQVAPRNGKKRKTVRKAKVRRSNFSN